MNSAESMTKEDIEQAYKQLKANNRLAIEAHVAKMEAIQELFEECGPKAYYNEILPLLWMMEGIL